MLQIVCGLPSEFDTVAAYINQTSPNRMFPVRFYNFRIKDKNSEILTHLWKSLLLLIMNRDLTHHQEVGTSPTKLVLLSNVTLIANSHHLALKIGQIKCLRVAHNLCTKTIDTTMFQARIALHGQLTSLYIGLLLGGCHHHHARTLLNLVGPHLAHNSYPTAAKSTTTSLYSRSEFPGTIGTRGSFFDNDFGP